MLVIKKKIIITDKTTVFDQTTKTLQFSIVL